MKKLILKIEKCVQCPYAWTEDNFNTWEYATCLHPSWGDPDGRIIVINAPKVEIGNPEIEIPAFCPLEDWEK